MRNVYLIFFARLFVESSRCEAHMKHKSMKNLQESRKRTRSSVVLMLIAWQTQG